MSAGIASATTLSVSTDYASESYLFSSEMPLDNSSLAYNVTTPKGFTSLEDDVLKKPVVVFVFSVLYVIAFLLGMFGNFLVCFVVCRQRTMQTVTNFFITNLAIADVLLCLFCVSLTPTYTFLGQWIFGTFLCHLVAFLQCFCVYLSTLTLTSIAIDRFFVIIFPFRPRMKICTCLVILVLIWTFALLLTFPYGYFMEIAVEVIDNESVTLCNEAWPTEDDRKLFGTVTSVLQFFLPFFIILVCYLCIFVKLQRNKKKLSKSKNSKKKNNSEKVLRKKTTTNQMLVLMVGIFGTCWLPLNVINILDDFNLNLNENAYYNFYFFFAHLLAMSSVIYNPFLYAWLNENFRKEFKQILPCLFVNISTHRELKNPKNFLSSLSRKKNGGDNLIRNDGKTIQETTFLQPNHEHVMISVETVLNDGEEKHPNGQTNDGNLSDRSTIQATDKNNLIIKGCDEIASSCSISPRTSTSRTQDTSIS
jgi:neuropeptide F receptor